MGIGRRIDTAVSGGDTLPSVEKSSKDEARFELISPKYKLSDLVIPEATETQINNAFSFFENGDVVWNKWGLSITHKHSKRMCINFYGPPGTGKTMAAHAVAERIKKNLIIVNYAEIESKYVGDTPKNLVALFKIAEKSDAVIFFDEADAMLSRRVTNMKNSTDTSVNQSRSVLLNILNDYEGIVLFATNFIENFDPAFMRRILAHVKFDLPDEACCKKLFEKYTPFSLPHRMDFDCLSREYNGLSGGDISNSILLAAFGAANRKSDFVEMEDVRSALDQIVNSKIENSGKMRVETRSVSRAYVEENLGAELK